MMTSLQLEFSLRNLKFDAKKQHNRCMAHIINISIQDALAKLNIKPNDEIQGNGDVDNDSDEESDSSDDEDTEDSARESMVVEVYDFGVEDNVEHPDNAQGTITKVLY